MADQVSIDIVVRNRATGELQKVTADLGAMEVAGRRASQGFSESFRPVLAATRSVATEIGSSLNPALGNMVGGMGIVARGAGAMGLALGGVTAALVVGGAALKGYLDTQHQVAENQAKLNLAVRSFDLSAAKGQVAGFRLELDVLDQKFQGTFGNQIRLLRVITDALGVTTDAVKGLAAAQAATAQIVPFQRNLDLAKERALREEAFRGQTGVFLGRAEQQNQLPEFERLKDVFQKQLHAQTQALRTAAQAEAIRDVAEAQAQGQPAAEISRLMERGFERVKIVEAQSEAARADFLEKARRGRLGIIERQQQAFPAPPGLEDAARAEGLVSDADIARGAARIKAIDDAALATKTAQVTVLREIEGLESGVRLQLELQVIEAERVLKVSQANLDTEKIRLVDLEASIRRQNAERQDFERTDALAGLSAGFREAARSAEASGAVMRSLAGQTAQTMQEAFSNQFFSVITGDFKKLPEVGKQFAQAMVRNITDAFATMATAPLLRSLQQGLGGLTNVRGLGVLGGGLSGGGGVVEVGGQLFQAVAAGAGGPGVLVPVPPGSVSAIAGTVTSAAGAVGGGRGGSGSILSLFSQGSDALTAFLNTPLSSVAPSLFGGAATAQSLAFMGADAGLVAGAAGGGGTAVAGATIGTALGAAGAALALAFTIYSGLTTPPTTESVVTNAISGAISGAVLGSAFGGYGAAIGAVAGGILGGGAAMLGKPDPAAKKARQQAEVNRALDAARGLGGAVGSTQSLEELYLLLASHGSGTTGGTSGVAIVSHIYVSGSPRVGPPKFVGTLENPFYPLATLEEFAEFGPNTYVASIQAGVNPAHLSGPNVDLETAVRSKIKQLKQLESQIELFTTDVLESPFGGDVSRTTTIRASEKARFAGRQFNVEGTSLGGLDDEQKVKLLKELAKLDADLSLGIIFRDPATDAIVSVSAA